MDVSTITGPTSPVNVGRILEFVSSVERHRSNLLGRLRSGTYDMRVVGVAVSVTIGIEM
jgi:tetrahydromethanopterin S-methyltransferase subunit F